MYRNKQPRYFLIKISDCLAGVFILLLFFSPLKVFSDTTGGWEKVIDKNGIVVYTRKTGSSLIKEQKTISTFHTSMNELVSLIKNIKNREKWFRRLTSVEILKEFNPDHFIFRMIIDMPYPLIDKELIQELQVIKDHLNKMVTIKFSCRPDYLPPDDNYIRVRQSYGHYELRENPDGSIHLFLISLSDPGKGVPPGLYNLFVAQAPYRLILNFHEEVNQLNSHKHPGFN
jgi:hypothetical protein